MSGVGVGVDVDVEEVVAGENNRFSRDVSGISFSSMAKGGGSSSISEYCAFIAMADIF